MKWKRGTYQTGALRSRLEELLPMILERAHADREAGRKIAEQWEELDEVAREYVALLENGISANQETIRCLERAIVAVQAESVS